MGHSEQQSIHVPSTIMALWNICPVWTSHNASGLTGFCVVRRWNDSRRESLRCWWRRRRWRWRSWILKVDSDVYNSNKETDNIWSYHAACRVFSISTPWQPSLIITKPHGALRIVARMSVHPSVFLSRVHNVTEYKNFQDYWTFEQSSWQLHF